MIFKHLVVKFYTTLAFRQMHVILDRYYAGEAAGKNYF